LNALNTEFAADLGEVVDRLHEDEKIRAVILTGKGRAFCAGGDLAEFRAAPDPRQFIHELAGSVHKSVLKMRGMNAPWVAAINGPCFGVGLSLASCCDLRVASTDATFSVGFTGVGLSPDSSLLYYLPKIVGLTKATEMTLDASFSDTLEQHLELELGCVSESAGTADFQEGCAAFFERRKPEFKGR
jgi:2-(1,2-epoxy-1,2-dihydrophenyl)acetyl-CoA isomerase